MKLKIGWGTKITMLYVGFVLMMTTLVIASVHQHFNLETQHYYTAELGYQKVIDASKNMAALSGPISIHANEQNVIIELPKDLSNKHITGTIDFYSPVQETWDKKFPVDAGERTLTIPRKELRNTRYVIKVNIEADGKAYYQQSGINLYQ